MTDVSVSECVSMVHPISDGSRPTENHTGPADPLDGLAVPPTPPVTNNKVESSDHNKRPRPQKPVTDGGPVHQTQSRPKDHRIHRYSPFGVPKPSATGRVQRMVQRAQREFEKAEQQSPYHSKHSRPAIPTPEAYQSVQMGHQNMERMVRDDVPPALPSRIFGQPKHRTNMGATPTRDKPHTSRMKSSHDRIIDQEFNRDVSQCLVIHGGRALGLERTRCETSGLKALVEKNISSFETQSDAMKLCCLLVAKKLNQITENWVGSE